MFANSVVSCISIAKHTQSVVESQLTGAISVKCERQPEPPENTADWPLLLRTYADITHAVARHWYAKDQHLLRLLLLAS